MQTFQIKPDGIKEIKKKLLTRAIPVMIIAATAGVVIGLINSRDKALDPFVFPVIVAMAAASIGFGLYRAINRQKTLLESYRLTITNNLLEREQLHIPTTSLYFNDIKKITRLKNGDFRIQGKAISDVILIPAQIENYLQLETTLQQIQPVLEETNTPFLEKYQALTGLIMIGLMLRVYTLNNKIIVGLSGIILIPLMVWSLIRIQNTKNIDNKVKRTSWWILLVVLSVITIVIFKLTAQD